MRAALTLLVTGLLIVSVTASCSSDDDDDSCVPDDADGVASVPVTVVLAVDDTAFAPAIITTQNTSPITLTLTNNGTKAHGFSVDCLPTPNARGCPTQSCFPEGAKTAAAVAPGASATITFTTPAVEGIYTFRSTEAGDTATGQFILK